MKEQPPVLQVLLMEFHDMKFLFIHQWIVFPYLANINYGWASC